MKTYWTLNRRDYNLCVSMRLATSISFTRCFRKLIPSKCFIALNTLKLQVLQNSKRDQLGCVVKELKILFKALVNNTH